MESRPLGLLFNSYVRSIPILLLGVLVSTLGGCNGYSGGLAPLNPPAARGEHIWIQVWQYIPIYPAIIPIYALLSDTLGVLGSDISGGSPRPPYAYCLVEGREEARLGG